MPRIRILTMLVTTGAFLVCAAAAQATVTTSNITSPANGAYLQANDDVATTLTVTGTSNGTTGDQVDIDCFYNDGNANQLATGVNVDAGGSFTVTAPLSAIAGNDCRLRAEPAGSSDESPVFAGPRIAVSEFSTTGSKNRIFNGPNNGTLYDYFANGTTFGSYAGWNSAGDCGPYGNTIDPTYTQAPAALSCDGWFYYDDGFSRSELQVDGKNAYPAWDAYDLFYRTGPCTTSTPPFDPGCDGSVDNAGFPSLSVSQSWNPANGFESTQETDAIADCTGADGYRPADQTACPSFTPSGLALQRSSSMIGTNQILMTDTWTSTDGNAHNLDALYEDDSNSNGGSGRGYQFPGETGFSRHALGDVVAGASSAPGSVFVHTDVSAADNDPDNNYGAITFSSAPSYFVFSGFGALEEHQAFTVPAGGSIKLSYVYSFSTSLEQVQALALSAQDLLHSPAVSITSPGNGAKYQNKTKTKKITVSGTATAGSGIKSLTVAGHAVSVGSNGAWSTTVTLKRGTQTITATALDNAGLTASAHITVIYAKACVIPHVKGQSRSGAEKTIRAAGCQVGKIKKVKSKIKKGHAVKTNHKAGKKLKPGAKIKLYVSEG